MTDKNCIRLVKNENKEKPPVLLVYDELFFCIHEQLRRLKTYSEPTLANFLFSYSLFEGLLRELSFQIYYAFPIKLKGLSKESNNNNDKLTIEKDTILSTNDYYDVLNSIIDSKLSQISKGSIFNYLIFFMNHSGIHITIDETLLKDMSEARNIIAHNNISNFKSWNVKSKLRIDELKPYDLQRYMEYIIATINSIKSELERKYKKYTPEKLLLDSWSYTCPKRLPIYKIFDFSSGSALIKFDDAINEIQAISSGEKHILSIWLENYNIEVMYRVMSQVGQVHPIAHITSNLIGKIRYLQQLFREYPNLMNGFKYVVENGEIKA